MIHRRDFERGREAIAVLQGRRSTLSTRPSRFPRRARLGLAAVVTTSTLLVAVVILAREDPTAAPVADGPPDPPGVVVQAPSPSPSMIAAVSHAFSSWDQAQNAVPWAVAPTSLPAEYELAAIQGFSAPFAAGEIDSVIATYVGSQGGMLTIDEFYVARPDAFDVALTLPQNLPPEIGSGQVQIGDATGYWTGAVIVENPVGVPRVDQEAIVLTWAEGTTGFRLTGRGMTLETLLTVAESMAN